MVYYKSIYRFILRLLQINKNLVIRPIKLSASIVTKYLDQTSLAGKEGILR